MITPTVHPSMMMAVQNSAGSWRNMITLTDAEVRRLLGARAREAVLPLTPASMTLQLVLLYRDLIAAAVAVRDGDEKPAAL